MTLKLAKKLPLYMLNPDAKTIGGKHTKKNVSSLNFMRFIASSLSWIYKMNEISIPIGK